MNMPVITIENYENFDLSGIIDPALRSKVNIAIARSLFDARRCAVNMNTAPRMIGVDNHSHNVYMFSIDRFFNCLKNAGVEYISLDNDCNDEYTFKMFRQETLDEVSNRVEYNKKKMISHIANANKKIKEVFESDKKAKMKEDTAKYNDPEYIAYLRMQANMKERGYI